MTKLKKIKIGWEGELYAQATQQSKIKLAVLYSAVQQFETDFGSIKDYILFEANILQFVIDTAKAKHQEATILNLPTEGFFKMYNYDYNFYKNIYYKYTSTNGKISVVGEGFQIGDVSSDYDITVNTEGELKKYEAVNQLISALENLHNDFGSCSWNGINIYRYLRGSDNGTGLEPQIQFIKE